MINSMKMINSIKRLLKKATSMQVTKIESYKDGTYSGVKIFLSGVKMEDIYDKESEIINIMSDYIANNEDAKKIFKDNTYTPEPGIKDEPINKQLLIDIFSNAFDECVFKEEPNDMISYEYSVVK